eukprot:TRINITY_DN4481_c0_g1_i1.p1 TRINITY_DN4481_c0_g1~~TRINITY_DN4481_c0_g1_i1.p1  ORF type:complete len:220 (-),score=53.72 TRINITY_DN4481_c0_g1_i1:14-673(-)
MEVVNIPNNELLLLGTELCQHLRQNTTRMIEIASQDQTEESQRELMELHRHNSALLVHLRGVNRDIHLQADKSKTILKEARENVDSVSLLLQNSIYESANLQQQIDLCNSYQLSEPHIELIPEQDFLAAVPSANEITDDHHQLEILRYQHELQDRKRLQDEAAQLKLRLEEKKTQRNEANIQLTRLDNHMSSFYKASLPVLAFLEENQQVSSTAMDESK